MDSFIDEGDLIELKRKLALLDADVIRVKKANMFDKAYHAEIALIGVVEVLNDLAAGQQRIYSELERLSNGN